jgi:hypothetical protein
VEELGERIVPATFLANNTADVAGAVTANAGTLRQCITSADQGTDPTYTITLTSGQTYTLSLTNTAGHESANATGDLNIFSTVNSNAAKTFIFNTTGAVAATIDASFIDRVFEVVGSNITVQFNNIIIQNGLATDNGTNGTLPGQTDGLGGGILNEGANITFTNTVVSHCTAGGTKENGAAGAAGSKAAAANGGNGGNGKNAFGGGLYSTSGTITLNASTFSLNKAQAGNAGVGGAAFASNSTANQAVGNGGNGGVGGNDGGGAIYAAAGNVVVDSGSNVVSNMLTGGQGGNGGLGGNRVVGGVNAGNGGNGGDSGTADGGGIYAAAGNVTIDHGSKVSNNDINPATGDSAGNGGAGGKAKVSGDNGGVGGAGGVGHDVAGGGVWIGNGSLTVDHAAQINTNIAGLSGKGGFGGSGGVVAGVAVGGGGAGGNGGSGGNAFGGGAFVQSGNVVLNNGAIVTGNSAHAGTGGGGGNGGTAGSSQGNGGKGGNGANGGGASGGGIYAGSGTVMIEAGAAVTNNTATEFGAGTGGRGGKGGTKSGVGGSGGNGGASGNVAGGGVYDLSGAVSITGASKVTGNKATGHGAANSGAGNKGFSGGGAAGNGGNGGNATGGGVDAEFGVVTVDGGSAVNSNSAAAGAAGGGDFGASGTGAGANGGAGGNAGTGGNAAGGGIYAKSGAVSITGSSLVNKNKVTGGTGGSAGGGGKGAGGKGGVGGTGGLAGTAQGAGVWDGSGNVTVDTTSSVNSNLAMAHAGGGGGFGGQGAHTGAAGGNAGAGGNASGGGVYAAGGIVTIDHHSTITKNDAFAGVGGTGGVGGAATKTAGQGGSGSAGGAGGNAEGGGVWINTGSVIVQGSAAVQSNDADGRNAAIGGAGGAAPAANGKGGKGSDAAPGGNGLGGGIFSQAASVTITGAATVQKNFVSAGSGAAGGKGGTGAGGQGAGGRGGNAGLAAGGGIYAAIGATTISGGAQIIANTASGDHGGAGAGGVGGNGGGAFGGGVWIGNGSFNLNVGNVSKNVAKSGGNGGTGGAGAGGNGGNGGSVQGGGVYISSGASSVTIKDASFYLNTAEVGGKGGAAGGGPQGNGGDVQGGGLYTATTNNVLVSNSTLLDNFAKTAGGGAVAGQAAGGGIYNKGTLALHSDTVANNTATDLGGGVANTGTLTLVSTIIAGDTATSGPDLSDTGTTTASFSLIQSSAGHSIANGTNNNQVGVNPLFGSIQQDTGNTNTWYINLKFGSPAIDAGNNPDGVTFDQIGRLTAADASFQAAPPAGPGIANNSHFRVQNSVTDIGAVESPGQPPPVTVTQNTTNLPNNATVIVIAGTNFSPTPANDSVVFNDGAVGTVASATATTLTVQFTTMPQAAGSLTAVVTVNGVSSGAPVQVATVVISPTTVHFYLTSDNKGNVDIINSTTKALIRRFRPFDNPTPYTGQMSVALGDVNGDGVLDIIVATRGARAGKVKVFDGARALNTSLTLKPGDTLFQKIVLPGYQQGLTLATGNIGSSTQADIIVGLRSTTLTTGEHIPATVIVLNGAAAGFSEAAKFHPFTAGYTGGVYVAAGPTAAGGKAQIAVSQSNSSNVQIWSLDLGVPVLASEFTPFGSSANFVAAHGDGQIVAVESSTAGIDNFATAELDHPGGVVTIDVNNATGAQQATFTHGSGLSFFAIDRVNLTLTPPDDLMFVSTDGSPASSIDLVNSLTGATSGTLPTILALTGKVSIVGNS